MQITKKQKQQILKLLESTYQEAKTALHFDSVFQLLVAVILSAQTNDNQVNKITKDLFARYPGPKDFLTLSQEELEQYIRTCGLYKNKAKNILAASRMICDQFDSQVPQTRENLMLLPGVGRKTANVILNVGFGKPALAVDTHVFRVARRLGLSSGTTPDAVEKELCLLVPEEKWGSAHHWLIWHGRKICVAQKPKCGQCPCEKICPKLDYKPKKEKTNE